MSFAIVKAGKIEDVRTEVAEAEGFKYGGGLGELTKKYLAEVLALIPTAGVIVEASGHADANATNVNINVRPVF
jgi:hypothetical protein